MIPGTYQALNTQPQKIRSAFLAQSCRPPAVENNGDLPVAGAFTHSIMDTQRGDPSRCQTFWRMQIADKATDPAKRQEPAQG